MTGLDADSDHILEMACLITDSQLNIIAEVNRHYENMPIQIYWNFYHQKIQVKII